LSQTQRHGRRDRGSREQPASTHTSASAFEIPQKEGDQSILCLSVELLELGGRGVAQRLVQAVVVKPGDVLDDALG
jgi:hypothetical protein